jgi:hypothetical protein
MKKLLGLVLFTSILISQDVITTSSNVKHNGELVEEEEHFILFRMEGRSSINRMPKYTIDNIKKGDGSVLDFSDITEMPYEIMSLEQKRKFDREQRKQKEQREQERLIREEQKEQERLIREKQREQERLIREKCEGKRLLRFMVIPIKDDFYGLTEEVESILYDSCFSVIDNIDGLAYLDEKKVRGEDINDFHLTSIGKDLKLNFILYGYTYTVEEPFKFAGNPSSTAVAQDLKEVYRQKSQSGGLGAFFYGDPSLGSSGLYGDPLSKSSVSEEGKRSRAAAEAGTYLGFTLFQIDINTGEKKILINNSRFRKL